MGTVREIRYDQVAPGDVAFDRGRSTYGRLVALSTREDVAHCFVYHRRLGTTRDGRARWLIGEMSARHGAQFSERVEAPSVVMRPWRLETERTRLLSHSRDLVRASAQYDWLEIGRIVVAMASGRVLDRGATGRAICVAHVHRAILAARPDLAGVLPSVGEVVTPGRLLAALRVQQPATVRRSLDGLPDVVTAA